MSSGPSLDRLDRCTRREQEAGNGPFAGCALALETGDNVFRGVWIKEKREFAGGRTALFPGRGRSLKFGECVLAVGKRRLLRASICGLERVAVG